MLEASPCLAACAQCVFVERGIPADNYTVLLSYLTNEPHTNIDPQLRHGRWSATLTALYVSRLHTHHSCTGSTGPSRYLTPHRYTGVCCTLLEGHEVEKGRPHRSVWPFTIHSPSTEPSTKMSWSQALDSFPANSVARELVRGISQSRGPATVRSTST